LAGVFPPPPPLLPPPPLSLCFSVFKAYWVLKKRIKKNKTKVAHTVSLCFSAFTDHWVLSISPLIH